MDSPEITCVELCAGYGGICLGLKRAIPALRVVAACEIEAFAVANLVAKMEAGLLDSAPIWTDLKSFPWGSFRGRVHILVGGYPCQPFSAAGKRKGADDPRHLWPWIADGIAAMRPEYCFFENVEGHISLGLREVIGELESLGYRATAGIFSAAECGAPHQRKRVFILAHRNDARPQGRHGGILSQCSGKLPAGPSGAWPSHPGEPQHGWEPPRTVGHAKSQRPATRLPEHEGQRRESAAAEPGTQGKKYMADTTQQLRDGSGDAGPHRRKEHPDGGCLAHPIRSGVQRGAGVGAGNDRGGPHSETALPGRGGEDREAKHGKAESPLGGNFDGAPGRLGYAELCVTCDNRTDELRLLGNGVVPAVAEKAWRVLFEEL